MEKANSECKLTGWYASGEDHFGSIVDSHNITKGALIPGDSASGPRLVLNHYWHVYSYDLLKDSSGEFNAEVQVSYNLSKDDHIPSLAELIEVSKDSAAVATNFLNSEIYKSGLAILPRPVPDVPRGGHIAHFLEALLYKTYPQN
jgi:hypothetical protein